MRPAWLGGSVSSGPASPRRVPAGGGWSVGVVALAVMGVACTGGTTDPPVHGENAGADMTIDRTGWPVARVELADRARDRFDAPTRAPDPSVLIDAAGAAGAGGAGSAGSDAGAGRNARAVAPIVVDVREPRETDVSRVPGAVLLPDRRAREAFIAERSAAGEAERAVLVYCTAGWRSAEATLEFRAAGLPAYNLEGGVCAWAVAGGPLVDADGAATRRIHAYSADFADCVPSSYEIVVDS